MPPMCTLNRTRIASAYASALTAYCAKYCKPGAHWHREGYTAAILPGSGHVAASDQAGCLATFLDSALAASRLMHGL